MIEIKNMKKFKEICTELEERFSNISYENGDISDVGNEVGIIIAKYFSDDFGDKNDFINGMNHGVSLTDGTHN